MALGTSRPRNGGVEFQVGVLNILLHQRKVNYRLVSHPRDRHRKDLWLNADDHHGLALPSVGSVATLVNTQRGRWEARDIFDGHVLATGYSLRVVITNTIRAVWN